MAMKISTISPVESRVDEISWLRLLVVAVPDELTGSTFKFVGARDGGRGSAGPDQPVLDREHLGRAGDRAGPAGRPRAYRFVA